MGLKLTHKQLKDLGAWDRELEWFDMIPDKTPRGLLRAAKRAGTKKLGYCNWIVVRLLSDEDKEKYAKYSDKVSGQHSMRGSSSMSEYAAWAATYAADYSKNERETLSKIIEYGVKLLEGSNAPTSRH